MDEKMEQYIFDESNGLWYQQCGDYYIPCLALTNDEEYQIGKYGRMHRSFLQEYHPVLYSTLLARGTLWKVLIDVDRACRERMEVMCQSMKEQEGVTEALKAANQMEWVRCMNSIRDRAEESILHELVYVV